MTYQSPSQSKFQLYLNNRDQEEHSNKETSSAGDFTYILHANIAPLLFMRSVVAQVKSLLISKDVKTL